MHLTDYHNVTVAGQGRQTLVFSHGFGCDQGMFRKQVDFFRDEFKIVTYDLAGSNGTDSALFRKERYRTLEGYADDLIAIIEALELTDIVHVGHSVSATIGLIAANKRPELFDAQVLIAPSARYINDGDYVGGFTTPDIEELLELLDSNYAAWCTQLAPAIMGNADQPEHGKVLERAFNLTDKRIAAQFARVTFFADNRADLGAVSIPTLVLQCNEDILVPEPAGRFVHENIPGSQYVKLAARGHCPHISAAGATNRAIQEFLQQSLVAA